MAKIALDLDGVLADFHGALALTHGVKPVWQALGKWKISDGYGIPEPWWQGCDYKFWSEVPKTKDADEILQTILKYIKIEDICILTSLPTKNNDYPFDLIGIGVQGKIDWLKKHYPQLLENFLIGPSKHFLASINSILIDDLNSHVDNFRKNGGSAILVPRLWNRNHPYSDIVIEHIDFDLRYYLNRE